MNSILEPASQDIVLSKPIPGEQSNNKILRKIEIVENMFDDEEIKENIQINTQQYNTDSDDESKDNS